MAEDPPNPSAIVRMFACLQPVFIKLRYIKRQSNTKVRHVRARFCRTAEISAVNLDLEPQPFVPQYDDDGNQTLVKTKTGIWSVTYNGENRPISWTCGATNIVMKFDRMGRRVELIETITDPVESAVTTNKYQKFVYDGYLCIQRLNGANNAVTDLFEWDPTEPVATRPLYWQPRTAEGHFSLFYTHDGNKNVSEVVFYQRARGVAAHYEYAPFGEVTVQTRGNAWGSIDLSMLNLWRFSSECADDLLGLVYYNYRHYEPITGRWLSRDPLEEGVCLLNAYLFLYNAPVVFVDYSGKSPILPIFYSALRSSVVETVKGTLLNLIPSWYDEILDAGGLVSDAAFSGCGTFGNTVDDEYGFHQIKLYSTSSSSFLTRSLLAGLKQGSTALINQFAGGALKRAIRNHSSEFLNANPSSLYYKYYKRIERLISPLLHNRARASR